MWRQKAALLFLKSELAETDYLCLKYTDGALSEDEYAPIRRAAGCVPGRDQRLARG